MKPIALNLLVLFYSLSNAACQDRSSFEVAVIVHDQSANPVPNTEVKCSVPDRYEPGEGFGRTIYKQVTSKTDSKGTAILTGSTYQCEFVYIATMQGYYSSAGSFKSTIKDAGRWTPWSPRLSLTLKSVIHPIPLKAKRASSEMLHLPADKVGYDLDVGDLVAPHGKGKVADLIFSLDGRDEKISSDPRYDSRLTLTFSNQLDGIATYLQEEGAASTLIMPHLAPDNGYVTAKTWRKARMKGDPKGPERGAPLLVDDHNPLEHYFLRLRTRIDEDGKIESAHYAKIMKGFEWAHSGFLNFQYHFNPTPNDRNLEFDPKQNLFKDLPKVQQVMNP